MPKASVGISKPEKNKNARFIWMLALSILLHIAAYLYWLYVKPEAAPQSASDTIRFVVQSSEAPPIDESEDQTTEEKEDEQAPPPEQNDLAQNNGKLEEEIVDEYKPGDEFASNNQDDPDQNAVDLGVPQLLEEVGGTKGSPPIEEAKIQDIVTTTSESSLSVPESQESDRLIESDTLEESIPEEDLSEIIGDSQIDKREVEIPTQEIIEVEPVLEIPPEFLGNLGNMRQLSDIDLDKAIVKDPFSRREAREFRAVNFYLRKISEQIQAAWVNPLTPAEQKRKLGLEIRMEIGLDGKLINAWIHLHSDVMKYEQSLLDAIYSIERYDTSSPASIRQKYRYLRITHSNAGFDTELMPFEKEKENDNKQQKPDS